MTTNPLLLGALLRDWPPTRNSRASRSDVSLPWGEGIEAGGTRAGGAVGLPGVWRFLMSPVRRGPAGQARSWEAGGPWRESTLPACPGHHSLACPASRPCHGALPLATAPVSRRRGRSSGTCQHPPFPQRAGRQASRSGHRVLLRQVQTGGCLVAHGADPAEAEGLPSPAFKPASRSQKAQAWEESCVPLLPGSLAGRAPSGKHRFYQIGGSHVSAKWVKGRQRDWWRPPPGRSRPVSSSIGSKGGPAGVRRDSPRGTECPPGPQRPRTRARTRPLAPLGPPSHRALEQPRLTASALGPSPHSSRPQGQRFPRDPLWAQGS